MSKKTNRNWRHKVRCRQGDRSGSNVNMANSCSHSPCESDEGTEKGYEKTWLETIRPDLRKGRKGGYRLTQNSVRMFSEQMPRL